MEVDGKLKAIIGNREKYLNNIDPYKYSKLNEKYTNLNKAIRDYSFGAFGMAMYGQDSSKIKIDPYIAGGIGSGIAGIGGGLIGYSGASARNASIDNAAANYNKSKQNLSSAEIYIEMYAKEICGILNSDENMKEYIYNSGKEKASSVIEETREIGIGELEIIMGYKDSSAIIENVKNRKEAARIEKEAKDAKTGGKLLAISTFVPIIILVILTIAFPGSAASFADYVFLYILMFIVCFVISSIILC